MTIELTHEILWLHLEKLHSNAFLVGLGCWQPIRILVSILFYMVIKAGIKDAVGKMLCVCVYVCMCVCLFVCMCTCIYVYECMNI